MHRIWPANCQSGKYLWRRGRRLTRNITRTALCSQTNAGIELNGCETCPYGILRGARSTRDRGLSIGDARTPSHAYIHRICHERVLTFVGDVWPFWCVVVEAIVGTGDSSRGTPDAESPLECVRTVRGLDEPRWTMDGPADEEGNSFSDKKASLLDGGWGSAPACPALRLASGWPAALIEVCRKPDTALGVSSPWLEDRRGSGVRMLKGSSSWEYRR